jgi:hypothetical protein
MLNSELIPFKTWRNDDRAKSTFEGLRRRLQLEGAASDRSLTETSEEPVCLSGTQTMTRGNQNDWTCFLGASFRRYHLHGYDTDGLIATVFDRWKVFHFG